MSHALTSMFVRCCKHAGQRHWAGAGILHQDICTSCASVQVVCQVLPVLIGSSYNDNGTSPWSQYLQPSQGSPWAKPSAAEESYYDTSWNYSEGVEIWFHDLNFARHHSCDLHDACAEANAVMGCTYGQWLIRPITRQVLFLSWLLSVVYKLWPPEQPVHCFWWHLWCQSIFWFRFWSHSFLIWWTVDVSPITSVNFKHEW